MPNQLLLERLREDGVVDLLVVPTTLVELDAHLQLCWDRENVLLVGSQTTFKAVIVSRFVELHP
jgi:hypothetical protein